VLPVKRWVRPSCGIGATYFRKERVIQGGHPFEMRYAVVFRNPVFDFNVKLFCLDEDLFCFCVGRNIGESIVDSISLPSTRLKIVGVLVRSFTQHQFRALQGHPVVSDLAHDPIPRTGYGQVYSVRCEADVLMTSVSPLSALSLKPSFARAEATERRSVKLQKLSYLDRMANFGHTSSDCGR